jgi:hypothetical protein
MFGGKRTRIYPSRDAFEGDRLQYEQAGWYASKAEETLTGLIVTYRRQRSPQTVLAVIVIAIVVIALVYSGGRL